MLKGIVNPTTKLPSLIIKPFICGEGTSWMSIPLSPSRHCRRRKASHRRSVGTKSSGRTSCVLKDIVATEKNKAVKVKAVVKVQVSGVFANILTLGNLFGKSLLLELVSAELDPETRLEKRIQAYARKANREGDEILYEREFTLPFNFGEIGAILVENEHRKEIFMKEIALTIYGVNEVTTTISCESWVHSKFDNPEKRVFFTSKSYLPSQTPNGLTSLRQRELEAKRGDGTGERKMHERIYDYDVYNDLGDPDKDDDMARPVLGGNSQYPYPRRCRTGRPKTKKDPQSESRAGDNYIPRDENFSEVKQSTFSAKTLRSVVHALVPSIESALIDVKLGFPYFTAIDSLYNEGIPLPKAQGFDAFRSFVPRLVKAIAEGAETVLQFETPEMMDRDKFAWFRDEEFARQTLAGINPYSIKLIKEFPLVSKLDPEIYGPPESLITGDLIEEEIEGVMTVERALQEKRLFIIDYHDLLLPYVNKVREQEGTTLYGPGPSFSSRKRELCVRWQLSSLDQRARLNPNGNKSSHPVGMPLMLGYGNSQKPISWLLIQEFTNSMYTGLERTVQPNRTL